MRGLNRDDEREKNMRRKRAKKFAGGEGRREDRIIIDGTQMRGGNGRRGKD